MAEGPKNIKLETVEPIGSRVLIRKDETASRPRWDPPARQNRNPHPHRPGGRHRAQVEHDEDYPIRQYDRVLFNPKQGIPVDFEGDNRLFVIPVEDVVAVFRKD